MVTRFLPAAFCLAALLPAIGHAAPLSLEEALRLASEQSLAARAARAGATGAAEAARAAAQLPDPMLSVGIDNLPATGPDRFRPNADFQTMKRIGISQEWVSPRKRQLREAAAQAQSGKEAAGIGVALSDARVQTALAYLDAFYASESLKLARETEHHLHEEFEAAKSRLASSSGSSQEVLALTASRGAAEDDSAEQEQQAASALVGLERWIRTRPEALVAPSFQAMPTEDAYVNASPAVATAQAELELARREVSAVAANRTANWTWQASYGQRTGFSDMVSFGVSIPLQIAPGERQDRETASKLALADKSEAALEDARRAVAAEYRALQSDVQRLSQRIERFKAGVLAPAQRRIEAALAGYRSNQVALMTVFEARHAEVDLQRKLLSMQKELAKVQAQLAFKPIPGGAQ